MKEIYDPNRQGVVYESRRSLDYPLPRQALIQPFEATDRQNVWLELHPELWSDCVFPFNPACGKAAFAASLYFPLSIRFWEEGGKKKKKKINLKTCPNLTLHLSLPFLQSFFFFPFYELKTYISLPTQVPVPCRCFRLICCNKCVLLFPFCFPSHLINSASHFFQVLGHLELTERLYKHTAPSL